MNATLAIDPALLAWDREDYAARQGHYWQLVEDFVSLLDAVERLPVRIVLSAQLAGHIIERFPADELAQAGGLHDFVRLIYTFLANALERDENYPPATLAGVVPDVLSRAHFSPELRSQFAQCLAVSLSCVGECRFASHAAVWGFVQREVAAASHDGRTLAVLLSRSDFGTFCEMFSREYEPHDKHDSVYGYGSRLPSLLTDLQIQRALDVALELKGSDCLCARVGDDGVVLIFRRHHRNKYHAYPIDASDHSRYGIRIADVPISPP